MPHSPDDNEKQRPARKPKRARRKSTPRRTTPTTLREKIDTHSPATWKMIEKLLRLPPQKMLAVIIKLVLLDRVTDEERYRICSIYHTSLMLNLAGWVAAGESSGQSEDCPE